jgi:Flp pilus assembly pilin Flp
MKTLLTELILDQCGQDLVEYSLLLAAIIAISAGLLMCLNGSIAAIWTGIDSELADAKAAAS